ncbi:hypothetical protein B0A52_03870 [Exophiala mesophila]|uniref:Uncharacterized protein n=1 Tax=Exophiala mesophila TaxID=212818 RepID=A0A438N7Q7_EXOME|nr:hypothetical protein B0A52_03870 [Exophiala mesophila]
MAEQPSELTFIFQGTAQGEGSRKAQKSAINRHVSRTTHQKRRQQRSKALHSHSHSQDKKDGPPDKLLPHDDDDAAAAAAAALISSDGGGEQSPDDGPSTYFARDSAKSDNAPYSSSIQSKPETSSSESVGLDKSLPGSDNDNDNAPEDSGSGSTEDPGHTETTLTK